MLELNFLLLLYLTKTCFIGVPGEPVEEGAGVSDASLHEHNQVEGLRLRLAQIQDQSNVEAALGNCFCHPNLTKTFISFLQINMVLKRQI